MFNRFSLSIVLLAIALSGCSTNPVTGKSEFSLISAQQEVSIGTKNYLPYQQQQGGQYVVDPELSLYVSQVGRKLAQLSDRPKLPYEFVVLNNDVPNAWALPGGKIAINRGLLVQLEDEAQLAAVLGHEIVHAAARHGALQQTQQTLLGIGVGIAGIAATQAEEYGQLIAAGTAVGAGAWQARYGRQQELESDYYGMQYMVKAGYDPQAAVELQEIFVKLSQSRGKSNWLQGLFASHPPSQERVEKNRQTAAQLGGGVRNRAQFKQAIAQVVKDQKAYDTHAKAIAAANKKDIKQALSLTKKAIRMQPQEPQFHLTLGKLLLNQEDTKGAESAFNKALSLYPEFYASSLGLGVASFSSKKYSQAERYLQQSMKSLATLPGSYYLGETLYAQNRKSEALQYFKQAAGANDELGKAAQKRVQELQPPPAQPQPAQ